LLARKTGIYNGLELRPKIPAKLNRNDEKSTEDEQYISHPRAALEAREECPELVKVSTMSPVYFVKHVPGLYQKLAQPARAGKG
jgi:hypothetical protein